MIAVPANILVLRPAPIQPVARPHDDSIVVEPYKEQNGPRDVDEGVDAINPMHQGWVVQKDPLDGSLVEDS